MDPSAERPVIHCVVGHEWPGGVTCINKLLTLDEAAALAAFGWRVLLDPFDVESLIRWEQMQRAMARPRNKW
jgi:hypothetical protein